MEKVHVYITGYWREIEIGRDGSVRTMSVVEANIPADPSGIGTRPGSTAGMKVEEARLL